MSKIDTTTLDFATTQVPHEASAETSMDLGVGKTILPPGSGAFLYSRSHQSWRVVSARVEAVFPRPWWSRFVRRIPSVSWLLRGRDAAAKARASAQVRIEHVAVNYFQAFPDHLAELPIVHIGSEISARVNNVGDRPVDLRVIVQGDVL